jgi:hypothetical protein
MQSSPLMSLQLIIWYLLSNCFKSKFSIKVKALYGGLIIEESLQIFFKLFFYKVRCDPISKIWLSGVGQNKQI